MNAVFLYGRLLHAPLRDVVLPPGAAAVTARLAGYAARWDGGMAGPVLVPGPGAVDGLLLDGVDDAARGRLAAFCAVFGQGGRALRVEAEGGARMAEAFGFHGGADAPEGAWDAAAWQARWGAAALRLAGEVTARLAHEPPERIARHLEQAEVRAASFARAQAGSAPMRLRAGLGARDVDTAARRLPYTDFFQLEERDLRFRRFDGTMSDPVTRAGFVAGDAVTVLPYDPVRDRVLLIEQFRAGPYMRGDRHPWSLEPVAGRIDPGEAPEVAARREAHEEAGLALGALELVARYYPSPGAVSEYLYSYVGIADLPDGVAGIHGAAEEHEDIRGLVLDFAGLQALLASGEAENGPLVLTAWWLTAHRARLRGGA